MYSGSKKVKKRMTQKVRDDEEGDGKCVTDLL